MTPQARSVPGAPTSELSSNAQRRERAHNELAEQCGITTKNDSQNEQKQLAIQCASI